MQAIYKSEIPQTLLNYIDTNSEAATVEWDHFKNSEQIIYKDIVSQLIQDQHGLCCYCENDLALSADVKDFCVEHFHPKSLKMVSGINPHVLWENLLACCLGGANQSAGKERGSQFNDRYTAPNLHCDQIKGNKHLCDEILNPLHLATKYSNVPVFDFEHSSGKIIVHKNCPVQLKWKAENTILQLNLNEQSYLVRARKAIIEEILSQIQHFSQSNSLVIAINIVKSIVLKPNDQNHLPNFYSCRKSCF